jgi:uncharacterized SAM-binding protein YcdF (DUF218 family)
MNWLYDRLTRNETPKPADLIFVFAGRMERKQYGLELYRAKLAPRLLLSIGRFEVSKMRPFALQKMDELIAARDRTPAEHRHFFYEIDGRGVRWQHARMRRWSTYGEVLALKEYLERGMPRSIIAVSSDLHLRRIAVTIEKVFRGVPLDVLYCPVLPGRDPVHEDGWWRRSRDRSFVLLETVKLAAYQLILRMPDRMIPRLMRLKD